MTDDTLPEPLVPAEVDLRDFPFMPLDVARLRDSDLAANETPEACWAAVLLWSASWHQVPAGSIPDDDRWIAKQAGYAQRGKISKEWADVRPGALHGWVRCADGRLYHPVVAEKALDGWRGKLRQRHASEMARVKKHNQRHGTSLPCPSFDAWIAQGCPHGQDLPVPRDKSETEPGQVGDRSGTAENVPREMHSKREGERQGQGERDSKPSASPPAAAPPVVPGDTLSAAGDLERRCRLAVGQEPCLASPDFGAVLSLLDEPGITEADVVAGIAAALAKADRRTRFTHWAKFAGWIRGAARDRLGKGPRPATASAKADDGPTIDLHDKPVAERIVVAEIARWVETGVWPDWAIRQWGSPPGEFGCEIPRRLWPAGIEPCLPQPELEEVPF